LIAQIDEFTLDPSRNSTPRMIFADPKGNLYVLGSADDVIRKWWIVRRKRPADREWTIADRFQLESGQPRGTVPGRSDHRLGRKSGVDRLPDAGKFKADRVGSFSARKLARECCPMDCGR
jgi:hypothetical protein